MELELQEGTTKISTGNHFELFRPLYWVKNVLRANPDSGPILLPSGKSLQTNFMTMRS